MKKTIKRALSVLLCAALMLGAAPLLAFAVDPTSGSCGDTMTWVYDPDTCTLTISGTGEMDHYETGEYGEYNLTITTAPWRPYFQTMKHLVIEPGVETIGSYAFYFCMSLESVSIPNTISYMLDAAFAGCLSLSRVEITDLEAWCRINFRSYISNPLYYGNNLYLNGELVTDLVIPNGVDRIRDAAFSGCTSITSVTIPSSVITIGGYAFYCCAGLTDVVLPNSIEVVNYMAFCSCTGLKSATISDSMTSIGYMLFAYCVSLESITFGTGLTTIQSDAFAMALDDDTRAGIQRSYDDCIEYGQTAADTAIGRLPLSAVRTILDHPNGSLTDVYYRGTEDGWSKITLYSGNEPLNNAAKHFAHDFMGLAYLEMTDQTAAILSCDPSLTEIAIPGGIDGFAVTSIVSGAFRASNLTTSVTIPKTVTSIGRAVFQITEPDLYHNAVKPSLDNMIAQYGADIVKLSLSYQQTPGNPYWIETVRFDEVIYYIDHGEWPTTSLTDVYYDGTEAEWNQIAIDPDNDILLGAELHFLELDHSHSYTSSVTSEQTCTTDGVTTYTCECGEVKTVTKPALGHSYTSEVTQEPTCSEPGVRTYTCSRCSHSYTESIATLEHTYESVTTKEPTCTETGLLTKTCTECHFVTTEVIPALGHSFDTVVTKEPTCFEEGSCDKTCTRCHFSCTEALPMTDHTDEDDDGVCDVCGSEDLIKSDIQVGETKTAEVIEGGQIVLLRFVPKVTGSYTLTATSGRDTYGTLYDADMNVITYNDDCYDPYSSDFKLTYSLIKGQIYYFGCKFFYSSYTGSIPVTLTLDTVLETLDAAADKNTVIDTMDGVIYGLAPNVTDLSAYFTAKTDYTCTYTPSGRNGETDVYSTGSVIRVYLEETMVASYKLVLFGDVDGDGWYDGTDAYFVRLVANGLIGENALSAAQRKACDANHDGAIDAADVAIIEQAGLLINDVDQTLTNSELETNSVFLSYCGLIDQSIESVEPAADEPTEADDPQPTLLSFWDWVLTLLKVILNWVLSVF